MIDDRASYLLLPCFRKNDSRELIDKVCQSHDIDAALVMDAVDVNESFAGSGHRGGINADFTSIIDRFIERSLDGEEAALTKGSSTSDKRLHQTGQV